MKLSKIEIKNFRNLKNINLNINSNFNIFFGKNGQGKTNLLETIYVLANSKTWRTNNDQVLINHDFDKFIIKSKHSFDERNIETIIEYNKNKEKLIKINNKKSKQNHPDRLKVVLFTPDDLFLVKGSPAQRRNFLDNTIKQISDEYNQEIEQYKDILKKRNFLLKKEQTNNKKFSFINDIFIENAVKIIMSRIKFLNLLDEISKKIYQEINNDQYNLKIKYALSFHMDKDNDKINNEALKKSLIIELTNKKELELKRKTTLSGPHVEDIHFYHDEKLAKYYASQGQQRNIAVSIKLAEIYAFKKVKNYFPIFLLDEVLSELDGERKKALLNHLCQAEFQSFFTSLQENDLDNIQANRYEVEKGNLLEKR